MPRDRVAPGGRWPVRPIDPSCESPSHRRSGKSSPLRGTRHEHLRRLTPAFRVLRSPQPLPLPALALPLPPLYAYDLTGERNNPAVDDFTAQPGAHPARVAPRRHDRKRHRPGPHLRGIVGRYIRDATPAAVSIPSRIRVVLRFPRPRAAERVEHGPKGDVERLSSRADVLRRKAVQLTAGTRADRRVVPSDLLRKGHVARRKQTV